MWRKVAALNNEEKGKLANCKRKHCGSMRLETIQSQIDTFPVVLSHWI